MCSPDYQLIILSNSGLILEPPEAKTGVSLPVGEGFKAYVFPRLNFLYKGTGLQII